MQLDWKTLQKPILALSPMADMTDSAFCQVVRSVEHQEDAASREHSPLIVFREMVSAEAVVRKNEKTLEMAAIHPSERPLVQQIFGARPSTMAEAARIIEEEDRPEGIDINMGCPVYKITSNFNGSALMKDPDTATRIVKEMKAAVSVPVSVKIRAGWSKHDECVEFAKRLEEAGADLITVHGRTKEQGYAGKSDRQSVAAAKAAVSIPVLYNGDVFTWEDYFSAIEETKCDGVLIARGALGNPWIFKQIEEKRSGLTPSEVTLEERVRVVRKHLELHLAQYGDNRVPTFRKHLSWYFKGLSNFKSFRERMMTASDKETLDSVLDDVLKQA